jgi:hypothetical protein
MGYIVNSITMARLWMHALPKAIINTTLSLHLCSHLWQRWLSRLDVLGGCLYFQLLQLLTAGDAAYFQLPRHLLDLAELSDQTICYRSLISCG